MSYAISQFKRDGEVSTGVSAGGSTEKTDKVVNKILFMFEGHQYNPFLHSFASGKLYIQRAGVGDIISIVKPDSILINVDDKNIDRKCKNTSISFKLDNMFLSDVDIKSLGECLYTQFITYANVEVIFRDNAYVKRYSYNMMFVLETNACVKKIPLVISVHYEVV